jgi:hypothetical protein
MNDQAKPKKFAALLTVREDPMEFDGRPSKELVEVTDHGRVGALVWKGPAFLPQHREAIAERYEIIYEGTKPWNEAEQRELDIALTVRMLDRNRPQTTGETSGVPSVASWLQSERDHRIAESVKADPVFTASDVEAEIAKYRDKIIAALESRATGYEVEAMALPDGFWLKFQIAGRAREARAIARLLVPGSEPEVEEPGEGGIISVEPIEAEPMPATFAERLAEVQGGLETPP